MLPSLPAPRLTERALNLLRTPPQRARATSSGGISASGPSTQFYTASWGSPYETAYQPSSFGGLAPSDQPDHTSTGSEFEGSDSSPIRHLDFYTPFLRPAPDYSRSRSSEPVGGLANVLAKRARRPARGLTEDWIRAHTGGEFGEGANWLSDEEVESGHSSLSSSISADSKRDKESDPRTPTLKTFVHKKEQDRVRNTSVSTLKQEDFTAESKRSRLSGMMDEWRPPLPPRLSQDENVNKAPPPPPPDTPGVDEWPSAATIDQQQSHAMTPQLSSSPAPQTARLKKKVPWKGVKTIPLLIPMDDERGQPGKAPRPMNHSDVANMYKEWQQLGYDTAGFILGHDGDFSDGMVSSRSRKDWPNPEDVKKEQSDRQFRVSIPDRKKWDEYVQGLAEEKLRALGVSLPGEELPPSISPALPPRRPSIAITRHAPMPSVSTRRSSGMQQYPELAFSPPLPTGSAASSHMTQQHPNPFSPGFNAGPGHSTGQSSNVGSIASPVTVQAQLQNKFNNNPRQPVLFGSNNGTGELPFGSPSPFPFPHQASPGVWSPSQGLFGPPGGLRGGSPVVQNPHAHLSSASPFSSDGYFVQDYLPLRHQVLDSGARHSPRLQDLREIGDMHEVDLKSPTNTTEANGINRQHNTSASLQKEIDDAEYHLEEQIQRQLDHEDYSPHQPQQLTAVNSQLKDMSATNVKSQSKSSLRNGLSNSIYATESDRKSPALHHRESAPLHHPQPHSRGHSLSQRPYPETDDDSSSHMQDLKEVNAKLGQGGSNTSKMEPTASFGHDRASSFATDVSNPWAHSRDASSASAAHPKRSGHSSKASISGLNVAAKEFKFDPTSAFQSNLFSFSNHSFQPNLPSQSAFVFEAQPARQSHVHQQTSLESSKATNSKINPDAPVFSPSSSTFDFAASGPSLRPGISPFAPTPGSSSGFGSPIEGGHSIFGHFNMAEMVKQPKRSKAVPIVRPDSPKEADDEMIDTDGRITRGVGREKRVRGERVDGDSMPLFATQPLSETSREQSPPKESIKTTVKAESKVEVVTENKENAYPSSENERTAHEKTPAQSTERKDNIAEYNGLGWSPLESFHERKDAEDMNASKALPIPKRLPSFDIYDPGSTDESSLALSPKAVKGHEENALSLSNTAKLFEHHSVPDNTPFTFGASLSKQESTAGPLPPVMKKPLGGLGDSIYAHSPSPERKQEPEHDEIQARVEEPEPDSERETEEEVEEAEILERANGQEFERRPTFGPSQQQVLEGNPQLPHDGRQVLVNGREKVDEDEASTLHDLSFEEIDERMRALNQMELETQRQQPTKLPLPLLDVLDVPLSPLRFNHPHMRSDAPSPSPRKTRDLPERDLSKEFEMPTTPPNSRAFGEASLPGQAHGSPIRRLGTANSMAQSDWNDMLDESEEAKLGSRSHFFDDHVNEIVGGILSERLAPIERTLQGMMRSVELLTAREKIPAGRRDRRSFSGDLPQSDADDEDDEHAARRSQSPRMDRKYEKIRAIVAEALAAYQPPAPVPRIPASAVSDNSADVLNALQEMRDQFGQSMRLDLRGEDLRNIVEEAVDRRMPVANDEAKPNPTIVALEAKVAELAEKLKASEAIVEVEIKNRRAAEDLEAKVTELTDKLHSSEAGVEAEIKNRRAAEDRLAEVQRLLRISSEEEVRLRESLDESEQKRKTAEDTVTQLNMNAALMGASHETTQRIKADAISRVNDLESQLVEAREVANAWKLDAEHAMDTAKRHSDDAEQANETNADLREANAKLNEANTDLKVRLEIIQAQLEEELAHKTREYSEENHRHSKREYELVARQELLDAKLQAEARTRERLEAEIERLEKGERDAMRAVSDNTRLDGLLRDLRAENHEAQKAAMKFKREFEEARQSGLDEVQRTRSYMQSEVDSANHEVNIVRDEMEGQISRLRAELDQARLDADTYRERTDMFLEEATEDKRTAVEELQRSRERMLEDIQTLHESKLSNTIEEARRAEQHLLERLSLSSARTEHLQDRVTHLEEKLEIAQAAARAAAQAARTAGLPTPPRTATVPVTTTAPIASKPATYTTAMQLPEKISPQALRESIMVLQEQLQDREQKIEQLEQSLSSVDLDAPNKISKRDDEITWLRELLGVRNADLQDIVNALSNDNYDAEAVRDAAIRLRANLQMEEQEKERAMNGGSAVNLPNIAASINSIRDAASPRIAQGVGSVVAAWGNWRNSSTPSKSTASPLGGRGNTRDDNTHIRSSLLSGLLTPPISKSRSQSQSQSQSQQPTAFVNTGRRLTAQQLASGRSTSRDTNLTPRAQEKLAVTSGLASFLRDPGTPPMMSKTSYDDDADARATDDGFSEVGDASFYDDDDDLKVSFQPVFGGGRGE